MKLGLSGQVFGVAIAAVFAIPSPASAQNGTSLLQFTRTDGKIENYYTAVDPNLAYGLSAAHAYFSDAVVDHRERSRAGFDEYVPIQLKRWRSRAAEAMMRLFSDEFFSNQSQSTGLVRTYLTGNDRTNQLERADTMNLRFPFYAARLFEWFPEDTTLRNQVRNLANGTLQYFSPPSGSGLLNLIHYQTGKMPSEEPDGPPVADIIVLGLDYGLLVQGMSLLSNQLQDPLYWNWAAPRIQFAWTERGSDHPLFSERYYSSQAHTEDPHTSTDTHYLIRWAYEGARLSTSDPGLIAPLQNAASWWYDQGWYSEWNQCARYMTRKTGAKHGDAIFGDGKWNCQYLYSVLYRMTGNPAIMGRMEEHWEQLLSQSRAGTGLLIDEMKQGVGVVFDDPENDENDQGDSGNQAVMLDALVDGYEATGNPLLLEYATDLAEAIRTTVPWPAQVLPSDNTARPFLRLAEASNGSIGRLEVDFPVSGGSLVIRRTSGATLFSQVLPNQAAVVYLPQGEYRVDLALGGAARSVILRVTADGAGVSYLPSSASRVVQGYVIRDDDDDGIIDPTEMGAISSRAYVDTNGSGAYEGGEPNVVVGSNGFFSFNVGASSTVRAVSPSGSWRWSRNSPNPAGSTPGHRVQFLTTGLSVTLPSFTLTQRMRVSGKVFHDLSGGGTQGSNEPNITETIVYLDRNGNNRRDFTEPYSASKVDGTFSIGNLTSGGTLRVVPRQAISTTTAPSGGSYVIPFSTAGHVSPKNFGLR
jgi:hypothetical protein